jgi:redox-sensitive bicupin YhaK (pirin superfamily)
MSFTDGRPMDVAPHPHIGLQTVTWILEGEVAHDDSLRCEAVARPGAVNVMTAGDGIAHAEWTPVANSGRLNGVQLWVALPEERRRMPAEFQHVAEVPAVALPGGIVQVFAGTVAGATSPAKHHSEVIGADVQVHAGEKLTLPVAAGHEHAALVLGGDVAFEGQPLSEGSLYYLGTRRAEATFASERGGRLLLIGGPPFPERILMWWNFVARTPEEIAEARADWEQRRRFGEVTRYRGPRLDAPALTRLARANPMS